MLIYWRAVGFVHEHMGIKNVLINDIGWLNKYTTLDRLESMESMESLWLANFEEKSRIMIFYLDFFQGLEWGTWRGSMNRTFCILLPRRCWIPGLFFSGGLSLCDTMCVSVESVKKWINIIATTSHLLWFQWPRFNIDIEWIECPKTAAGTKVSIVSQTKTNIMDPVESDLCPSWFALMIFDCKWTQPKCWWLLWQPKSRYIKKHLTPLAVCDFGASSWRAGIEDR